MAFIALKNNNNNKKTTVSTQNYPQWDKQRLQRGRYFLVKEGLELSGRLPLTPEELSLSWSYHLSLACDRSHWWAASQGLHGGGAGVQQAGGMSSAGPDGAACLPRKQYYLRCQASQQQVWTWPAVLANASLAASAAISASGYSSAYVTVISCDWIQVGTFKVDTELSSLFRESCLPPGSSLASWVPFPRHQILLISQALLGSVASHYQVPSWRLISTTKPCWSLPFPSSNAVTSRTQSCAVWPSLWNSPDVPIQDKGFHNHCK